MNQTPIDTPSHWRIIATCMNRDFLWKADSLIFIKMNGLCDDGNRERTISAAKEKSAAGTVRIGSIPGRLAGFFIFFEEIIRNFDKECYYRDRGCFKEKEI